MKTRKLEIACPVCGSREVVYSCTPNCCFNHVCADCHTTFEPVTTAAGGRLENVQKPAPPPEPGDPTAACAACGAVEVCLTEDGAPVCPKCGALLALELTEVAPGT